MDEPNDFNACSFAVVIPLRTVSAANAREHWAKKAARNRGERTVVAAYFLAMPDVFRETRAPLVVTFTRYGKRLLDDDNLSGSFKAIRDEVAKQLGRDDGPRGRVEWRYKQEKSGEYAVRIEVTR
jgi:hypothetical protein